MSTTLFACLHPKWIATTRVYALMGMVRVCSYVIYRISQHNIILHPAPCSPRAYRSTLRCSCCFSCGATPNLATKLWTVAEPVIAYLLKRVVILVIWVVGERDAPPSTRYRYRGLLQSPGYSDHHILPYLSPRCDTGRVPN